ncbi:MurR/RpiR family transcriptional regulator [Cloacibacillus evryensis]
MPVDINSSLQSDDVFARLRMGIKDLPTQQKLICSYILDNYQQVAFYTVEELAQASKTSPATVVRVVKRLGYDSYKELLEQLQKVMMTTNNSVWWELEQVMNNSSEVEKEPALSWVSRDSIDGIKSSLTRQLMDSFDDALELMLNAKKIGIVGMRSSKYVAGFLHFMMNQLFSNTHMLAASGTDVVYDEVLNLGKDDLIMAVSLGGPHFVILTQEILSFARERGIPSILITNDMGNPAIDYSTVTLCVGRTKYHYSIVQAMVLAEAIVTELALRKKAPARKKLKNLEDVLMDKGVTMP